MKLCLRMRSWGVRTRSCLNIQNIEICLSYQHRTPCERSNLSTHWKYGHKHISKQFKIIWNESLSAFSISGKKKIVLKHTTLSKLDRLELGSFYFVFGFFSIFFQNFVCLDLSVSIFYFNLLCGNLSIIMLHFDNFICPLQIAKNSYSPSDLLIHE